jgi:uncharacterized protein YrrD
LDIIYDDQKNAVIALLIDRGGLLSTSESIQFEHIQSIGEDAVIIKDKSKIVDVESIDSVNQSYQDQSNVKNKTIMTEDGKDLGKVDDLAIDTISGTILGYTASGGVFADLYKGKTYVPAPQTVKVGEDVLFVPNETAEMIEDQVGGLKKLAEDTQQGVSTLAAQAGSALEDTTKKAREYYESDQVQETLEKVKDKTQQAWDKTKQAASGAVESVKDTTKQVADKIKEKVEDVKSETAKVPQEANKHLSTTYNAIDDTKKDVANTTTEVKQTIKH